MIIWSFKINEKLSQALLTLIAQTLQNSQTHSNNSSFFADELLSVFNHFVGFALKRLQLKATTGINPFHAIFPFYTPLKHPETKGFSTVFRGCRNGTLT